MGVQATVLVWAMHGDMRACAQEPIADLAADGVVGAEALGKMAPALGEVLQGYGGVPGSSRNGPKPVHAQHHLRAHARCTSVTRASSRERTHAHKQRGV